MARVVAVATGIGALLGLAWWGLFELIASAAICSYEEFGCLGTAVVSVPVFAVVAWLLGWFTLRSFQVRVPWLVAMFATVVAVLAMVLLVGMPMVAPIVFAMTYALATLLAAVA